MEKAVTLNFVLLVALLSIAGYFAGRRMMERMSTPEHAPAFDYRDPYLVAALRNGPRAVVELAVVALLDRGLLRYDGQTFDDSARITTGRADAVEFASNGVERALLQAAGSKVPKRVSEVVTESAVVSAANDYARRLVDMGMKADGVVVVRQRLMLATCFLPAAAVVLVRMATVTHKPLSVAFVGFLVIMPAFLFALSKSNARGKAMLEELTTLFGGLQARAAELRRGRMSNDAVFCGAAFGLQLLPATEYPAAAYFSEEERKRRSSSDSDSGGGGSCGLSSCGSSDGGGGGGDGGGGGCGGGCGGGG